MKKINRIEREDIAALRRDFLDYEHMDNVADEYQRISSKSAIYPGIGTPIGLSYVANKLNGEAGEFAEHVGKAMRDDGLISIVEQSKGKDINYGTPYWRAEVNFAPPTAERRQAMLKEIGDQLWYLGAAARELGATLSECMVMNLEKLCDRTDRDTLRGSGDDR